MKRCDRVPPPPAGQTISITWYLDDHRQKLFKWHVNMILVKSCRIMKRPPSRWWLSILWLIQLNTISTALYFRLFYVRFTKILAIFIKFWPFITRWTTNVFFFSMKVTGVKILIFQADFNFLPILAQRKWQMWQWYFRHIM